MTYQVSWPIVRPTGIAASAPGVRHGDHIEIQEDDQLSSHQYGLQWTSDYNELTVYLNAEFDTGQWQPPAPWSNGHQWQTTTVTINITGTNPVAQEVVSPVAGINVILNNNFVINTGEHWNDPLGLPAMNLAWCREKGNCLLYTSPSPRD